MEQSQVTPLALVTGVTGFVGSSVAARLLKAGHRVVTLSRNDPEGLKTRKMVATASAALGFTLSDSTLTQNLKVVSGDLSTARETLTNDVLQDVGSVWHFAATLSYNIARLTQSMDVNVASTAELYRLVVARAPRCRRFYHCSTAYSVGLPADGDTVTETLHDAPRKPNVYQLSKWGAEMTLHALATELKLPVTILRPSVVSGHSQTGVYHGDAFGVYMFLSAAHRFLRSIEPRKLRLSPELRGSVDLIPIDIFVENSVNLHLLAEDEQKFFEIIQMTGTSVPTETLAWATARSNLGLDVSFEKPRSTIDHLFASAVAENRIFVATRFHFQQERLFEILQDRMLTTKLEKNASLVAMMNSYFERLDAQVPARQTPFVKYVLPWLSKDSGRVASTLAKVITERQRRPRRAAAHP